MHRVLLVEDDQEISELERDYLEMSDYEVVVATDGKEGLERALSDNFSLIILDVMLPSMDGFAVCKAIRVRKQTPILFVSAKTEDIDKIRGLGLGADDYIVKPFSPSELVARVKAHILRYERLTQSSELRANRNQELSYRDLTIIPAEHAVFVRGTEIKLKNKEFELLLFLVERPNIVFSKEQLFDSIWGLDAIGDLATIPVHINRLREKIEQDSGNPTYIETVWGAGYRFVMK